MLFGLDNNRRDKLKIRPITEGNNVNNYNAGPAGCKTLDLNEPCQSSHGRSRRLLWRRGYDNRHLGLELDPCDDATRGRGSDGRCRRFRRTLGHTEVWALIVITRGYSHMKKSLCLTTVLAPLALTGCVQKPGTTSPLITQLTALVNTANGDLNTTIAVATAATPPDTHGVDCAKAGQTVAANIQKELAAIAPGATVGVFTVAEVASLYQPGSAQTNAVVTTIETGCIAKLHDLNQAGMAPVGVFLTLSRIVGTAAVGG
jgi:hypothetical protein